MRFSIKHVLKIISCVLIAAFVVSSMPWQELSADANTHGEYKSSPLEITYDQNSTWGNSTQVFPYAIFASSKSTDFTFNGWKSTIVGDIYTGKDFVYQGSELYMDGYVRTAGTIKTSGWKINMTGSEKYIDPLQIPDWSKEIKAKEKVLPSISKSTLTSKDKVVAKWHITRVILMSAL
jgi:hypothetical protein